jgi:hypothetical protein
VTIFRTAAALRVEQHLDGSTASAKVFAHAIRAVEQTPNGVGSDPAESIEFRPAERSVCVDNGGDR